MTMMASALVAALYQRAREAAGTGVDDSDDEVHRSFEIANQLAQGPETVVHKAVGIFIKHAGRRRPDQQRTFLETHAATMPRPGLRLAIAHLEPSERQRGAAILELLQSHAVANRIDAIEINVDEGDLDTFDTRLSEAKI